MLRRGRIGLTAVLVAALMAVGASPAYGGAVRKAGVATNSTDTTLYNVSGFVKFSFFCGDTGVNLRFENLGQGQANAWVERKTASQDELFSSTDFGTFTVNNTVPKPLHIEWSVSKGAKSAYGQFYVADTGASHDCLYTSLVS